MSLPDLYPDWAFARVREIVDAQTQEGWHDKFVPIGVRNAFAKYIAEHEEAPVDPLLIEAREIVAKAWGEGAGAGLADECRQGLQDNDIEVRIALAGLRRGIEIGKTS